jgi:hypothetical protein
MKDSEVVEVGGTLSEMFCPALAKKKFLSYFHRI